MGLIIGLGGKSAGKPGVSSYVVAWDGVSEPDVTKIPAGVVVTYEDTSYTGTLAASNDAAGKIYLISDGTGDEYYRYVVSKEGDIYSWVPLGSTQIDLSDYATKEQVTELGQYIENHKWLYVITDANKKVLGGFLKDGSIDWAIGVPKPIKDYIESVVTPQLANKVDKEEGKGLIIVDFANNISYIDNSKWSDVKTDNDGKVLEGTMPDGTKIFGGNVIVSGSLNGINLTNVDKLVNAGFGYYKANIFERIELKDGKNKAYNLGNTGVGNTLNPTKANWVGGNCFDAICEQGDYFLINADGGVNPRAYAFTNKDNVIIAMSPASQKCRNKLIQAPIGATHLYINTNGLLYSYKIPNSFLENEIYRLNDGGIGMKAMNNTIVNSVTSDTNFYAYINGLKLGKELTNYLLSIKMDIDLEIHVGSFVIIDNTLYAACITNHRESQEDPLTGTCTFRICPMSNPSSIRNLYLMDIGDTFDGKTVTGCTDTVVYKKPDDNDTLYLCFSVRLDSNHWYVLGRTYTISTDTLSDAYYCNFQVGNTNVLFGNHEIEQLLSDKDIPHSNIISDPTYNDFCLLQGNSFRIEDNITNSYIGLSCSAGWDCIMKTSDYVHFSYVSQPDFPKDSQWETQVWVDGNDVFYYARQRAELRYGILSKYSIINNSWDKPVFIYDCQSRPCFFKKNNTLYLMFAPLDRNHLSILKINKTNINKSVIVSDAYVDDYFYPYVDSYNGTMYCMFTKSRQDMRLSVINVESITRNTIDSKMKELFNI